VAATRAALLKEDDMGVPTELNRADVVLSDVLGKGAFGQVSQINLH
jgi:hypothetical protein